MKKKYKGLVMLFSICMILSMILEPIQSIAETPYKTYTQDGYGDIVETQTAYTPLNSLTKIGDYKLSNPEDLKITEDGDIYVADTGNGRVLVTDKDGNLVREYGDGVLGQPSGIFVTSDKTLYVADKGKQAVFVFDLSGEKIGEYTKPDHPLYGDDLSFKPQKIAVDNNGNMYIICEGNTNGMVQISPTEDGTFLGYFGTNYTWVSFLDIFQNMIFTEEQKAKVQSKLPATPTNLSIDEKGLVYTVTQGDEGYSLKKLNIAGKNLIYPDVYDKLPSSVATGNYENIFVSSSDGYIYEYNKEGSLLFVFGGRDDGRQRIGLFGYVSALGIDNDDRIYVLDQEKSQIQIFKTTEFTDLVHQSLELYQSGKYTESKEPLEQVIEMNSLFDYANLAMGQAYLQEENYNQALKYFRLAKDTDGYSDSFWELRNVWLKNNLVAAMFVILAFVIVAKVLKALQKKKGIFNPVLEPLGVIREKILVKQLQYSKYFMKHPIDGCYGVKREGKASYLCANILFLGFIIVFLFNKYACGFIVRTVKDGQFDIFTDIIYILGIFALFTICTYLVCTINDGEGTFKQIYCGVIYALTPYLIIKPFLIIISNVITYNEIFINNFGNLCMYTWVVILLFLTIKEINNYTVKETIKIILLTAFTALIAVLILFIVYVLLSQVFDFIQAIYGEVVYRLGNM